MTFDFVDGGTGEVLSFPDRKSRDLLVRCELQIGVLDCGLRSGKVRRMSLCGGLGQHDREESDFSVRTGHIQHHATPNVRLAVKDILNVFHEDIHAGRQNNHFVLPALGEEVPMAIEPAEIARAVPAVLGERGSRAGLIAPVASEDVGSPDQDFTVVGQPNFNIRSGPAG